MEQKTTVDEVLAVVQKEIDAGKTVRARTYLSHCTRLGTQERTAIAKGLAPLKAEHITNTDLAGMNKAGCSVGGAALILLCFCFHKLLA